MGTSILFAASLLAMGPQWAIIDLPYPDVTESQSAGGVSVHSQVLEAAASYARARKPGPRKPEVSNIKVEGAKASATIHYADRAEPVQLVQVNGEWRVLAPER